MNILFITPSEVQPLNGGIERITYSLSQALSEYNGHTCYFRSLKDNQTKAQWSEYISGNVIDVIVAQGADKRIAQLLPTLREIIDGIDRKIILLFVFHSNPGVELATMDYSALFYRITHGIDLKANLQQLAWQLLKPLICSSMVSHLRTKYRVPYDYADKIVLLSPRFIPEYRAISGGDEKQFTAISNMLSFAEDTKPVKKEKIILVVSRMEERQKRIKLALKIWKKTVHDNWQLKIVGAGEDLNYYKSLAKKWQISDISFEGRQNPLPYYQKAPVFIMTSAFEGWGLTLTEAQQCGCVPIVFDTYASLPDIVTDGRNGFVIPEGDIDQYVARLTQLMRDEDLRNQMAKDAMMDCQRYTPQKVAEQWNNLFNELVNQK